MLRQSEADLAIQFPIHFEGKTSALALIAWPRFVRIWI